MKDEVPDPRLTSISMSPGMSAWLAARRCSLAFTSYATGQLFLVGSRSDGKLSVHQQNFVRAMGLHADAQRIHVGSVYQVWRLENVLAKDQRVNEDFDRLYVPRVAYNTGDVDIHELGVDGLGRVIFVNTMYSCLATLSTTHSFRPLWTPPFISALAPEDRCHLNGLAMEDGAPRYVTAVSASDTAEGWRAHRQEGGLLIDVRDGRIVTDRLSMPHSPRVSGGAVWVLDSGRGWLARIDPATGAKEDVAFCPGFLRGLVLHDGFAIVTASLPRDRAFVGLSLEDEIQARDAEPWCGLFIIDLRRGGVCEWLRLEGRIRELFDVAIMEGPLCPMAIGSDVPEQHTLITVDDGRAA